jgi:hypothetical protein
MPCARARLQLEMMETHALLQYFITHLERGSSHTKRVYPSNYARELYDVLPDAWVKLNYPSVRKQCCRGKIITRRTLNNLRRGKILCSSPWVLEKFNTFEQKGLRWGMNKNLPCSPKTHSFGTVLCCLRSYVFLRGNIQLINGTAGAAPQNAQYNNWPRSRHTCVHGASEHYHISLSGCQRSFALANCFLTLAR